MRMMSGCSRHQKFCGSKFDFSCLRRMFRDMTVPVVGFSGAIDLHLFSRVSDFSCLCDGPEGIFSIGMFLL